MANFKIVTDIDLSGNKLNEVTEINRGDVYNAAAGLDLTIKAGTNVSSAPEGDGGNLVLQSGAKDGAAFNNGSISLIQQTGAQHIVFTEDDLTITLASTPFLLTTGTGTITLTSTELTTVTNALTVGGLTTLGAGAAVEGADLTVGTDKFVVAFGSGNTALKGTLFQDTALTGTTEIFKLDADDDDRFIVLANGNTTAAGTLTVGGTSASFLAATAFTIGTNDTAQRDLVVHADTVIGSAENDKTLTVYGTSTFSDPGATATLVSDKLTANLFNTFTTTVNAFGNADTISIGASTGTTTINNNFQVTGETDYLVFDKTYTTQSGSEGTLFYSADDSALSYNTDIADTVINIGQEVVLRAINRTGSEIANGTLVYISGAEVTGNLPQITPAQANAVATSAVAGMATSTIADDAEGFITVRGIVRGVDTSDASAGDTLYLDYTAAGAFTHTIPTAAGAWAVKIGYVLNDHATTGSILINIEQDWSTTSTFNAMYVEDLTVRDQFTLPQQVRTGAGAVYWTDASKLITYHTGSAVKTVVDTNTTQELTGKTYNALTLTANAVGFSIAGGTTSKTFDTTGNVDLNADLTLNTGALTVTADASGSSLQFPTGLLDFSSLDPSNSDQKTLTIKDGAIIVSEGVETDSSGNLFVSGYIDVTGNITSPSATMTLFPDIVTTTLNIAQLTPNINIGNTGTVANAIEIGNAVATSVVNFNSTKNATSYTTGGVVIDGGVGIALNVHTNGKMYLAGNSSSNTLRLGADVDLYRSAENVLKIADDVIVDDLESANTTFNFATSTTNIMNMLNVTTATLNIGAAGANTRAINIFGEVTVGEASQQKDLNLHGSLNIGGAGGYGIQYDSADDSMNFVKL